MLVTDDLQQLKDSDIANDTMKALKAMEDLAKNIKITEAAFDSAHFVVDMLSCFPPLAPIMAVVGIGLSFLELFIPG